MPEISRLDWLSEQINISSCCLLLAAAFILSCFPRDLGCQTIQFNALKKHKEHKSNENWIWFGGLKRFRNCLLLLPSTRDFQSVVENKWQSVRMGAKCLCTTLKKSWIATNDKAMESICESKNASAPDRKRSFKSSDPLWKLEMGVKVAVSYFFLFFFKRRHPRASKQQVVVLRKGLD